MLSFFLFNLLPPTILFKYLYVRWPACNIISITLLRTVVTCLAGVRATGWWLRDYWLVFARLAEFSATELKLVPYACFAILSTNSDGSSEVKLFHLIWRGFNDSSFSVTAVLVIPFC